jgi:hypothetical protein
MSNNDSKSINLSDVVEDFPVFLICNEDREIANKILRKFIKPRPGLIIKLTRREFDYFTKNVKLIRLNKK